MIESIRALVRLAAEMEHFNAYINAELWKRAGDPQYAQLIRDPGFSSGFGFAVKYCAEKECSGTHATGADRKFLRAQGLSEGAIWQAEKLAQELYAGWRQL